METKTDAMRTSASTTAPAPAKMTLRGAFVKYMDKVVRVTMFNGTNPDKTTDRMLVPCTVTDIKVGFGNLRVKVEPVGGSGYLWVSTDRIKLA